MIEASFWFFEDSDEADPLISRQWRQLIPDLEYFWRTDQQLTQIWRNLVDYSCGDSVC